MDFFIEIDGVSVGAVAGESVADCAARAGIEIPRLCNKKGAGHRAGCMVCAVRDAASGAFLPSCASRVSEGMRLESGTPEVLEFRRASLGLLLSEHRGDCVAPCRKACPYGFDIPAFLEKIASGDAGGARAMLSEAPPCESCAGLCEKVCRRKLVDSPVKIRELIAAHRPEDARAMEKARKDGRYVHSLGRPSPEDLKALAEATPDPNGCLQCHCRADEDCVLRDIATRMGVRQPRQLAMRRLSRARANGVAFDSGKCVLCGACAEEGGVAMRGRAAGMLPSPPEGRGWDFALKPVHGKVCPTGAMRPCPDEGGQA